MIFLKNLCLKQRRFFFKYFLKKSYKHLLIRILFTLFDANQ